MAKKRNNKRPSRGHLYSWAGVLEFMKNNPELVEAAGQAVSSQSNNNQGAITPVQTNVNTQQPAVQQNNKYSNPTPTFQGQQRQQDMGNVPIFSSLGQKVDKLNKNLIGIADNNSILTEQKMNIPKDIWSRYYDFGGTMSAIEGGVDIVGDVAGDFRGLDLKKYKSQLNELASRNIEGASNDDLLDQYNDIHHLKHVGIHDITGGSYLTDVIGGLNRNAIAFGKGFSSTGSPWGGAAFAAVDLAGQIGGYFRRRNQVRHLNRQIDYTNARQDANFGNAVFNVDFDNDRALYRNFMKGYDGPYFSAAYGGPIHIADSKKGTFTAEATKQGMGVQAFASKVLANKDNYSPAMVKKANFARNASHWHSTGGSIKPPYNNNPVVSGYRYTNGDGILNYADGSYVIDSSDNKVLYDNRDDYMKYLANSYANGGSFSDFTNGVTIIGNGGTHEQNPFEGVQMGVAPDGKPNLVEEGEAIFNDYVFSNRLKVPKAVRTKYKLRGPKDMSFAEAFKVAQKESEERPNDPISKRGLENSAAILAVTQETLKQKEEEKNMRKKAKGGHLFAFGIPDNYPTDDIEYPNYNFTAKDWDDADKLGFDLSDPDGRKGYVAAVNGKTNYVSGMERVASNAAVANNSTVTNGAATAAAGDTNPGEGEGDDSDRSRLSPLRYFSTLANAGAVLSDAMGWTNKPTVFDEIKGPALIRAPRLGNYIAPMYLDTRYEANVLGQQANATRNALMQGTSPSRAANILAADAIAQSKIGDLMRNAELANYDLAFKRAEFNRGTDQTNAQMALTAAMENAKNKMANAEARLRQAKMNDEAQTLAWAAKAQNAKTLAENISNIGREQDAIDYRDMFIKMGPTLPDYMRPKGWSDKEWEDYKKKRQEIYDNSKNITACGGRIKRSKKRGLTY